MDATDIIGSSAFASNNGYDLKMDLSMNGKHVSSPRIIVKAGKIVSKPQILAKENEPGIDYRR